MANKTIVYKPISQNASKIAEGHDNDPEALRETLKVTQSVIAILESKRRPYHDNREAID